MSTVPRLLIVEDDLDLAEMTASYFSLKNYEVDTVAYASEALELTAQRTYHLIVLDIHLPDIDGFTLCRMLREQGRTKETPILFLTERSGRRDRIHGLELGVVDYITKPFDLPLMGLRVRNILKRSRGILSLHGTTELPDMYAVDERLQDLVADDSAWTILTFSIVGLNDFRERAGFMAADDVLRALALIVRNAVNASGSEDSFIGHLSDSTLIVITDDALAPALYNSILKRVEGSRAFDTVEENTHPQTESSRPRLMSSLYPRPTALPADVPALKKNILRATSA